MPRQELRSRYRSATVSLPGIEIGGSGITDLGGLDPGNHIVAFGSKTAPMVSFIKLDPAGSELLSQMPFPGDSPEAVPFNPATGLFYVLLRTSIVLIDPLTQDVVDTWEFPGCTGLKTGYTSPEPRMTGMGVLIRWGCSSGCGVAPIVTKAAPGHEGLLRCHFASSPHQSSNPVATSTQPEGVNPGVRPRTLERRAKSYKRRQCRAVRAHHDWLAYARSPLPQNPPWPPLRQGGKREGARPFSFPPLRRGGQGGSYRAGARATHARTAPERDRRALATFGLGLLIAAFVVDLLIPPWWTDPVSGFAYVATQPAVGGACLSACVFVYSPTS